MNTKVRSSSELASAITLGRFSHIQSHQTSLPQENTCRMSSDQFSSAKMDSEETSKTTCLKTFIFHMQHLLLQISKEILTVAVMNKAWSSLESESKNGNRWKFYRCVPSQSFTKTYKRCLSLNQLPKMWILRYLYIYEHFQKQISKREL